MSTQSCDAVVAGLICLDLFPTFTRTEPATVGEVFRPGTLIDMGGLAMSTGGAVANTGIAMKIFGANVAFSAKVGDDQIGRTTIQILAEKGDASRMKISKGESSSYTVIMAPPGIDRMFFHSPGTNATFTADDIDFSLLKGARLFHLGYPTLMKSLYEDGGDRLREIYRRAKETGITTSMDISLPDPDAPSGKVDWRALYAKVLPYVDIFVPSIEEAFYTLHPQEYLRRKAAAGGAELVDSLTAQEYSSLGAEFINLGCAMISLKAAHNGWYFKTGSKESVIRMGRLAPAHIDDWANREVWCPAFKVDRIASATGSGDSSIAAFLVGLINGHRLEECLRYANAAGCMNLSAHDATSGLASWDQVKVFASSHTNREIHHLPSPGWAMRETAGIWEKL